MIGRSQDGTANRHRGRYLIVPDLRFRLALFQVIVDNALDEIRHTWRSEDELELKVRLAAALFKIAEAGERDYQTLKSYTIAAVRSDLRDQNPDASA